MRNTAATATATYLPPSINPIKTTAITATQNNNASSSASATTVATTTAATPGTPISSSVLVSTF